MTLHLTLQRLTLKELEAVKLHLQKQEQTAAKKQALKLIQVKIDEAQAAALIIEALQKIPRR